MDGLLKGSCDACTASKVKCSGGIPCKRCQSRDLPCAYRPKRKRGPPKAGSRKLTSNNANNFNKSVHKPDDFAFVSSYEKRVWSTFFTMFKNQNRSRSDAPYAWCWFANQLGRLKAHLAADQNEGALNRLNAWLEALDVDLAKLTGGMTNKCKFKSHQCNSCQAIAMSAPNERGVPILSPMQYGDAARFDLNNNNRPRLQINSTSCGSAVQVNQAFTADFGLTADDLTELMAWSSGGFLPWGGDVLAKLLCKESDLLVFLQILAIKWQALGPPDHGPDKVVQREVPSTHLFDMWCQSPGSTEDARPMECPYILHCFHRERVEGSVMTTQVSISFERVGTPVAPKLADGPVSFEPVDHLTTKRPRQMESPQSKNSQQQQQAERPEHSSPTDGAESYQQPNAFNPMQTSSSDLPHLHRMPIKSENSAKLQHQQHRHSSVQQPSYQENASQFQQAGRVTHHDHRHSNAGCTLPQNDQPDAHVAPRAPETFPGPVASIPLRQSLNDRSDSNAVVDSFQGYAQPETAKFQQMSTTAYSPSTASSGEEHRLQPASTSFLVIPEPPEDSEPQPQVDTIPQDFRQDYEMWDLFAPELKEDDPVGASQPRPLPESTSSSSLDLGTADTAWLSSLLDWSAPSFSPLP